MFVISNYQHEKNGNKEKRVVVLVSVEFLLMEHHPYLRLKIRDSTNNSETGDIKSEPRIPVRKFGGQNLSTLVGIDLENSSFLKTFNIFRGNIVCINMYNAYFSDTAHINYIQIFYFSPNTFFYNLSECGRKYVYIFFLKIINLCRSFFFI